MAPKQDIPAWFVPFHDQGWVRRQERDPSSGRLVWIYGHPKLESEFVDYEKHRKMKVAVNNIRDGIDFVDGRNFPGLRGFGKIDDVDDVELPATKRIKVAALATSNAPPMPSDIVDDETVDPDAVSNRVVAIPVGVSPPAREKVVAKEMVPKTNYDFYCKRLDIWIPCFF